MPKPSSVLWFSMFFLMSCEGPHDKIARLQGELLSTLVARDYFEIKTGKQNIRLPLPLKPDLEISRANKISAINMETCSIYHEKLSANDQLRLSALCGQLNGILQDEKTALFDPTNCVLTDLLSQNTDPEFLNTLLPQIPIYYAEVERRWQIPSPAKARAAAEQSLQTLDLLELMGEQSAPASMAVKNFIGLCRSAACLR